MSFARVTSIAGVLLAAAASLATSKPPPDWARDDTVDDQITLTPEQEETVVRVVATSRAVASSLTVHVALDPAPTRAMELADTPIAIFVEVHDPASNDGSPRQRTPIPSQTTASEDGFEFGPSNDVPVGADQRVYELHFAWTSPKPEDQRTTQYVPSTRQFVGVERKLAPRRTTTIRWRAKIHAEGYDDAPIGATVDVELAP